MPNHPTQLHSPEGRYQEDPLSEGKEREPHIWLHEEKGARGICKEADPYCTLVGTGPSPDKIEDSLLFEKED